MESCRNLTEMVKTSDICVAVATHKAYRMPEDAVYLPLQVGKALHPDVDLGFHVDDTGENISELNGYFSELTGLYWMWKNCDAPYKGLVHYRRHFRTGHPVRGKDRFARIASGEDIASALEKADIVLPSERNYYIESIYSHYAHTFHADQLDETRVVLQEMCPEYVQAFDNEMQGSKAHLFNMFVMKREYFNAYCAWLFPILFEMIQRIDPSSYNDAFQARYPGRISERLLDTWLYTNNYPYSELAVISPEPVNWVKKGTSFLAAKFTGKKYESSF